MKINRSFGEHIASIFRIKEAELDSSLKPAGLTSAFTLVSFSAYSTLKMEAICSSETSVGF
jgi:hypothetical protein